jgi:hypothetical protein
MTTNRQCGCPARLNSSDELCIACQIEWEYWMLSTAMPAVRAAFTIEAAPELFRVAKLPNPIQGTREECVQVMAEAGCGQLEQYCQDAGDWQRVLNDGAC